MAALRQFFQRYRVDLTALLVVTIWGVSFPFRKAALAQFDVFPFTALRFVGMLILAWSVCGWHRHVTGASGRIVRADLPSFILSGMCGYTLYLVLGLVGLHYSTAFSNTLLLATTPLFVALFLWGLGLESLGRAQWLGLTLGVLGVGVFVGEKLWVGLSTTGLGDLMSLLAALAFAAYMVANKRLVGRYTAVVVTTYTLTIGAIPALLLSLPTLGTQDWSRITLLGWSALAWTVVLGSYLAWALWNWVIAHLGVARAAVFMPLVPLISGLLSWLLLGEPFSVLKLVGALLTLSGLALARRADPVPSPRPEPAEQQLAGTTHVSAR